MRKGIVCVATEQGIGRQAKDLFDNGIVQEVLVQEHSTHVDHYEWYPNRVSNYDELLERCDTIFFIETPFDWKYITRAREKGVRTVLLAMYECTRYPLPYFPDVIAGGSVLEKETYPDLDVKVITVPVPRALKWRKRTKARVFVHNAGHGGLGGRNGTMNLIKAIPLVKSPAKFIIRAQFEIKLPYDDPRVEIRVGDFPYESLFEEGDVFIYPDKFGGSCLPLQEAHASGMLVMASDRHPSNLWLPKEPLIPIRGYKKETIIRPFDSAIIDPEDIARTIDEWYDKDIEQYSLIGKSWGEANSWEVLKKEYEDL